MNKKNQVKEMFQRKKVRVFVCLHQKIQISDKNVINRLKNGLNCQKINIIPRYKCYGRWDLKWKGMKL